MFYVYFIFSFKKGVGLKGLRNKGVLKPLRGSFKNLGGSGIHIYVFMIILILLALLLTAYLHFLVGDKTVSFISVSLLFVLAVLITFLFTKKQVSQEFEEKISQIKEEFMNKIRRLRNEHDTSTLERTIRNGTQTLIKNAVDYFKIENIKNEMPASAAIQNLQLDKYGQIIELLADFSLILPDYKENQEIVQQELNHQIDIYQIDEKAFAMFLQRIMEKYVVTVNKKLREKADLSAPLSLKSCPRCAEKVMHKAKVCKHCGHEFQKTVSEQPAAKTEPSGSAGESKEMEALRKGRDFYKSGNYEEALRILTEVIETNPKFGQAYYNRGIIHEKLGNQQQALNDLTSAAQLGHKKAQKFLLSYMDTQEYPFRPT